jgi:hypothetical protein
VADRDENEVTPQPQEISVINEFIAGLISGADEAGEVHVSKTQADGTMRSWTLLIGRDPDGNERIISVDEDGTFIHVPIVTDPDGTKHPIAGTEDGVLKIDVSGAAKSQDVSVMNQILAELRLHSMYWEEMTEFGFSLEDLGEMEPKESA